MDHRGDDAADPVLARREQARRVASAGKRAGTALFGVAIGAFVIAMLTALTSAIVVVVIGSLVLGSLLLAPSIILGYAVRAAAREDAARLAQRADRDSRR